MSIIKLQTFGGRVPKISDRLLPDNMATIATNCKLYSGDLRPWKRPKNITTGLTGTPISAYKFIYTSTTVWLNFDDDVDVQRAPLVNDTYQRYYWANEGAKPPQVNSAARLNNGDAAYDLGVVTPDTDISIGAVTGGSGPAENRYYVYTYVTGFGEEGPPSNPVMQTGNEDGTWPLTLPNDIPTAGDNQNITKANIYRTVSGYSTTTFFYVEQITLTLPTGPNTHNDSATNETIALNSTLESTTWAEPPATLQQLITHPNGFLVGFTGRDIYMSYPYRPHAWPAEYVLSVDYDIVGLGQYGNTIVILTESTPYAMTGVRPEAMTLTQSKYIEPCVSKRSIVGFDNGVLYQSSDGIISTNGMTATNITLRLMELTDWDSNYGGKTLIATNYEGRYLAIDSSTTGLILDFQEPNLSLTDLSLEENTSEVFSDELTGQTYLIVGTAIKQWDPSNTTTSIFELKSKEFRAPRKINLGAAQIDYTEPDTDELSGGDVDYLNAVIAANAALIAAEELNSIGTHELGGVGATHQYAIYRSPLGGSGLLPTDPIIAVIPQLTFSVWADGNLKYQESINSTRVINLPSGFKADIWQFGVTGNVFIHSIDIAETPKELTAI